MGFSLPSRRIRCLIEGSSGGRPRGREPRPLLLFSRSRCHLTSVSGPPRKLFHWLRDRTGAAAARKARSDVVSRTRPPPRRRTLSWWWSTHSRDPAHRGRTGRAGGAASARAGGRWTRASGQSDAGSGGLRTARSEWPIEFLYPTGLIHGVRTGRAIPNQGFPCPSGPEQVAPHPSDLQVGLIDMPAISDEVLSSPSGLRELRREPLDPPVDADVIDLDAALRQPRRSEGKTEPQVPADRQVMTSGGKRYPAKAEYGAGRTGRCRA
jgi:hypothetical protein